MMLAARPRIDKGSMSNSKAKMAGRSASRVKLSEIDRVHTGQFKSYVLLKIVAQQMHSLKP
jgi:hypothetical protein